MLIEIESPKQANALSNCFCKFFGFIWDTTVLPKERKIIELDFENKVIRWVQND